MEIVVAVTATATTEVAEVVIVIGAVELAAVDVLGNGVTLVELPSEPQVTGWRSLRTRTVNVLLSIAAAFGKVPPTLKWHR